VEVSWSRLICLHITDWTRRSPVFLKVCLMLLLKLRGIEDGFQTRANISLISPGKKGCTNCKRKSEQHRQTDRQTDRRTDGRTENTKLNLQIHVLSMIRWFFYTFGKLIRLVICLVAASPSTRNCALQMLAVFVCLRSLHPFSLELLTTGSHWTVFCRYLKTRLFQKSFTDIILL